MCKIDVRRAPASQIFRIFDISSSRTRILLLLPSVPVTHLEWFTTSGGTICAARRCWTSHMGRESRRSAQGCRFPKMIGRARQAGKLLWDGVQGRVPPNLLFSSVLGHFFWDIGKNWSWSLGDNKKKTALHFLFGDCERRCVACSTSPPAFRTDSYIVGAHQPEALDFANR